MKVLGTVLAVPLAILAAAGLAQAGTIKYDADGSTKKLAPNEVSQPGPATITTDDGKDTLRLRRGAIVRFLSVETDAKGSKSESYFLVKGGVEANTGYYTRLATPAFWAFPEKEGARATFYAESFGVGTGYARVAKSSGMVRLLSDTSEVHLSADQGATIERGAPGEIAFTTDTNNAQRPSVRVVYPLATGILVDLYVPKATSGFVRPKPGVTGKTLVMNRVSSWKSGAILVSTYRGDSMIRSGLLAPGVPATIDNATGGIEFGGVVAVEFATLQAAVSLTSEFESLATSPLTKPKNN